MSKTLLEQIKEQSELVKKLKAAKEPPADKVSAVIIAKYDLEKKHFFFLPKNVTSLQKFIKFKESRFNSKIFILRLEHFCNSNMLLFRERSILTCLYEHIPRIV